jgi:hypothetical protein
MPLNRRVFLSASLTVAVGGSLQLLLSCRSEDGTETRALIELTRHYSDLESIRRVGREALQKLPGEIDIASLIDDVVPTRLPEALRGEIREQYEAGKTLLLGGWPIALTEARIYALVALAREGGSMGASAR